MAWRQGGLMVVAGPKGGRKTPPTAKQIAGFFEEWKRKRPATIRKNKTMVTAEQQRNTRDMPCETLCVKIAQKCASIAARHDQPDPIWAVGELIARDSAFVGFGKKMGMVIAAANKLETALSNFRSWKNNFAGLEEAEMPPKITAMEKSTAAFLSKWRRGGKPGPGRPESRENLFHDFFAKWIAEWCKEALDEAGWRENASARSEQGPAVYVTAKILSALEGKCFSPEWVKKAIERANSRK